MTIELRVACTTREMDHARWLRHEVYVKEEGRFGGKDLPEQRIVDHFDDIPRVAHVVAYDGDEPVGVIRLNCDTGLGLPPESVFDFRSYIAKTHGDGAHPPVVASGGMLAVRRGWRHRRDVTPAIYRMAGAVFQKWGTTHIIATVSQATLSLYPRMGFVAIADETWQPTIGDHIVPIVAKSGDYYRWAFGETGRPREQIWLERREGTGRASQDTTIDPALQDGVIWQRIRSKALRPEPRTKRR